MSVRRAASAVAVTVAAALCGLAVVVAPVDASEDCRDDTQSAFCEGSHRDGSTGGDAGVGGDGEPTPGDNEGGGSGTGGVDGAEAALDLPPLSYRLALGTDADGSDCVLLVAQWVEEPLGVVFPPGQAATMRQRLAAGEDYRGPDIQRDFPVLGALGLPLCPHDGQVADVRSLAWQVWIRLDLPSPAAKIAPGYMLPGLTAYLELAAPPRLVASRSLPDGLGSLTIRATPEHHVDWDDGGEVTVTSAVGVPFPGGPEEITHVYVDAGERHVGVTTRWTGTFTGPGFLDEPLGVRNAPTTVLPLEVRQWQSVRTAR